MEASEPRLTPSSSTSHNSTIAAASQPHSSAQQLPLPLPPMTEKSLSAPPSAHSLAASPAIDSGTSAPQQLLNSRNPAIAPISPQLQQQQSGSVPPLSASPAAPTGTAAPSATAVVSNPPPALRVLVAEDSVPNLKLLLVLLRKCKVDAVGVENGQLAVDAFTSFGQAVRAGQQPPPFHRSTSF